MRRPFLAAWGGAPGLFSATAATAENSAGGVSGGGSAGPGGGRVLDFRRRGAPPRRRRRSLALALARPLGIAILTVALPLGLAAWVLTSSRFQLHGVTVTHRPQPALQTVAPRVQALWVRQALAPFTGRNLLRLPLVEVRQRLGGNPWIASADVTKELPDRLRVTLAERRPVVLLRHGEELLFADAAGRPIAPVASAAEREAARRQGLLVVRFSEPAFAVAAAAGAPPALASFQAWPNRPASPGLGAPASGPPPVPAPADIAAVPAGFGAVASAAAGAGGIAGALRLADQLRRLRPAWTSGLTEIEVMDEDDYRLRIDGLPCPLLVRGSRLADNLARFEQLLPELKRRYPALLAVDLRFARRIVVQLRSAQSSAGA